MMLVVCARRIIGDKEQARQKTMCLEMELKLSDGRYCVDDGAVVMEYDCENDDNYTFSFEFLW